MKREMLQVAKVYKNGSNTPREIISIEPDGHGNICIDYALLRGRNSGKPLGHTQSGHPIYGCYDYSFQRWAKEIVATPPNPSQA